jgi:galactokinase
VPNHVVAFGPGRANLIGEHTDYNDGLSLPFAIEHGVRVTADRREGDDVLARALDYREQDAFPLRGEGGGPARRGGWRDFVTGALAELRAAGAAIPAATLTIEADVPAGAGLGSSAALEVALCLALLALAGEENAIDRVELARLCSRIENDWVGARTGLLDQLASLFGCAGHALRIDFRTLETELVPLELGEWKLVAVDSGDRRANAASSYNERRSECERARELLGVASLRDPWRDDRPPLRGLLHQRVKHVRLENERVESTVHALRHRELDAVASLLDSSHESLRDLFNVSTPTVDRTVETLKRRGALAARIMGGGFGGSVLALLPPGARVPDGAIELRPADGARVLDAA